MVQMTTMISVMVTTTTTWTWAINLISMSFAVVYSANNEASISISQRTVIAASLTGGWEAGMFADTSEPLSVMAAAIVGLVPIVGRERNRLVGAAT
jgi:hypothetical protein